MKDTGTTGGLMDQEAENLAYRWIQHGTQQQRLLTVLRKEAGLYTSSNLQTNLTSNTKDNR